MISLLSSGLNESRLSFICNYWLINPFYLIKQNLTIVGRTLSLPPPVFEHFDRSQDGIAATNRPMRPIVEVNSKISLRLNNSFAVFKIPPYREHALLHTPHHINI